MRKEEKKSLIHAVVHARGTEIWLKRQDQADKRVRTWEKKLAKYQALL
jgi:hypothetical protein